MKPLRANLDENHNLFFCIGAVKGCTEEKTFNTCDKCIPASAGETLEEVRMRIKELPDIQDEGRHDMTEDS